MIDQSHLVSRLRDDARDLETANARHESPDRVLVASAANLMRWAAETIESRQREIDYRMLGHVESNQ